MPQTEISSFSPQLLQKFSELEEFCSGKKEIASIHDLTLDTDSFTRAPDTLYFNRWHVLWIRVTSPFRWIASLFFSAIAKLSSCIGTTWLMRKCTLLSRALSQSDEHLKHQDEYGKKLLVPATNAHTVSSDGIIAYGTIPYASLIDKNPLLEAMTFNHFSIMTGVQEGVEAFFTIIEEVEGQSYEKEEKNRAQHQFEKTYKKAGILAAVEQLGREYGHSQQFERALNTLYLRMVYSDEAPLPEHMEALPIYSEGRLCRGACFWFLYLYLKTENCFSDTKSHLIAVAKQFLDGIPPQGALLQTLKEVAPLLHLRKKRDPENTISYAELKENAPATLEKVPLGASRAGLYRHSTVYIKVDENEGYLWDPNAGLLTMSPNELLPWIHKQYFGSEESHSKHVYFEQLVLDTTTEEGVA